MNHAEWLDWRKRGLGSSDAPTVDGTGKYMSRKRLWEIKTGRYTKDDTNWAMLRGTQMEPRARAHYEFLVGFEFPPVCFQHPHFPLFRASADGWNETERKGVEIKCPGEGDHALALAGSIPPQYYAQVQHQMFVTGAREWDYFSFDGERGVILTMQFDLPWFEQYWLKALRFWDYVERDECPPRKNKFSV